MNDFLLATLLVLLVLLAGGAFLLIVDACGENAQLRARDNHQRIRRHLEDLAYHSQPNHPRTRQCAGHGCWAQPVLFDQNATKQRIDDTLLLLEADEVLRKGR